MKHASAALLLSLLALVACSPKESAAPAASAPASQAAETPTPATTGSAGASTSAPAEATTAAAGGENEVGKKAFNKTCSMCHASGAGGAPRFGDKADWGPRIAQGKDVLYKHALEGFTGAKGMMPPRGGSTMTDDEVKAAVDYMADKAR